MGFIATYVLCIFLIYLRQSSAVSNLTFPSAFKFGAATASYQVEGAWDEDGKGANIWDHLTHTNPSIFKNNYNGDVACDSYHKYKEDVQMLKQIGVNFYRFSLSWSRILPTGYTNKVNQKGVDYYKNLIAELKNNNIEPLITIYHWDLPQPLQELGGWTNDRLVDLYAEYARTVFDLFGADVKSWITFNEVKQVCHEGYGTAKKAPAISSSGIGEYKCTHVVLKAHAKAYHIYQDNFKEKQGGKIGIVIDSDWYEPETDSAEDVAAAETGLQFRWGWFINPIVHGNYPQIMIDRIGNRSKLEGFSMSRLPVFTEDEINDIKGTYDFLGLNHYSTTMAKHAKEPEIGTPSWEKDTGITVYLDPSWPTTASEWLIVVPWGLRKVLKWIKDNYNNPEIIITENGYSDYGALDDVNRANYIRDYLSSVLEAIYEDKVNVAGYTVWSLMDNFEWYSGYTEKLGIFHVDFNNENRTRTAKYSAQYYTNVTSTRCLVDECEPLQEEFNVIKE